MIVNILIGLYALKLSHDVVREQEENYPAIDYEQSMVDFLNNGRSRPYCLDDYLYGAKGLRICAEYIVPKSLEEELAMKHDEYVIYLMHKYGQPTHAYFTNKSKDVKDPKIERREEGLVLHHMAEECRTSFDTLVEKGFAKFQVYDLYKPHHFIYCNALEHLILHIKIALDDLTEANTSGYGIDISGARTLWRDLNTFFTTGNCTLKNKAAFNSIKDRRDDYIKILRHIAHLADTTEIGKYFNRADICQSTTGVILPQLEAELF